MSDQLQNFLLLSFAGAINFPILSIIIMLLGMPKGNKKATYLFIGGEIVLLALGIISVKIAPNLLDLNVRGKFSGEFDTAIGIILFILAIYNYFKPEKEAKEEKIWGDFKCFLLGIFLMATNLNTLVLFIAAIKNLLQISSDPALRLFLLFASTIIINLMIITPIILNVISPELVSRLIRPINDFIDKHKRQIVTTVLLILSGVFLLR